MKDKLLIIDGHNLLFQMFFGMPSRIVNHEGKPIQGVIGFVGALIKIIKLVNPQYVVVLFDGEHENKRADILPEYKADRIDYSSVADEDNPFTQLEDVYKALRFIGIKFCEVADVETDDVIASYAHCYGDDMQLVISSWDSDFFQLINDNVKVLRYRGKNTVVCDAEYVENRFGVKPKFYADFKALVGDKADNIKGAEKIGPKTAAMLLAQFGSIESILESAEGIERKGIRESIEESRERLLINYKIIKLDGRAVDVPFELGELKFTYNEIRTGDVLSGIGIKQK